jgi:hypothetical protein
MAWFRYKCPDHGDFRLSLSKRQKTANCPQCQKESRGIISMGSVTIMERLDNGAMARAVERIHNVEDLMEERSQKHEERQNDGFSDTEED